MAKFKVFDGEVLPFGEAAVIITTAWLHDNGGSPGAETFLILPEPDHPLIAHQLSFDAKGFEDAHLTLDEDFMLKEALGQAVIDLRQYIAEYAQKRQITLPFSGPALVEHDWTHLVHLWLHGKHESALRTIIQNTKAAELADKLKIAANLPLIKVTAY